MSEKIDFAFDRNPENSVQQFQAAEPKWNDLTNSLGVLKQIDTVNFESVFRTPASEMLNGFAISREDLSSSKAQARCVTGWATVYGPTGNRTADGSRYTGREQGVAIDLNRPVLDTDLGDKVVITNLANSNLTTTQIIRDFGKFGDPRRYPTPNGQPRLVDLTYGAAKRIGAGDMTPVKVCLPAE